MELTASEMTLSRRNVRPSPARRILSMICTGERSLHSCRDHRRHSPTAPTHPAPPGGAGKAANRPVRTGQQLKCCAKRRGHQNVMSGRILEMDGIEIHEGGLLLRPWQPGDAGDVFEACQDPEIQRWTAVPRPYLREHAEGFVGPFTEHAWATGIQAPFGVFEPDTPRVLASCGLVSLDQATGLGEIGYWTAPWARGRGVATRAAR